MTLIVGQVSFEEDRPQLFGQVAYQGDAPKLPLQTIAERTNDREEAIRRNNDNQSRNTRVSIPAQVVSFDPEKQTVQVQPLIREKIIDRATGKTQWVNLPVLPDVPVCFPQAGNFVMTMPIQAGDEVLLVFADMCLDQWWYSGGLQNWSDRRRHDLSDAIAVVGLNSVPNAIQGIALDATEIRTKDGAVKIRVEGDKITLINSASTVTVEPLTITMTPDDGVTGIQIEPGVITLQAAVININGGMKHNGSDYSAHYHTTSVGPTSPPVEPP